MFEEGAGGVVSGPRDGDHASEFDPERVRILKGKPWSSNVFRPNQLALVAKVAWFVPTLSDGTSLPARECFFAVYDDGLVDQVPVKDVSWPGEWRGSYEIAEYEH